MKKENPFFAEGLELEKQGKLEEAYQKYEKAAALNDAKAMVGIARMYMIGKFRPKTVSDLSGLLLSGGPIFPWSVRNEEKPDYETAIHWLKKAAQLKDAKACSVLGNLLASGTMCKMDVEAGVEYLKKAAKYGDRSAKRDLNLYCPSGKKVSDRRYQRMLKRFEKALEQKKDKAYFLYAALKSGTDKQLASLGYLLTSMKNSGRSDDDRFTYSFTQSGIPILPAAAKRGMWKTFLRFNLDAFKDEYPLIAVASDILNVDEPGWLLHQFHRAEIAGKAEYRSPAFGWLGENKKAVVLRLGTDQIMSEEEMNALKREFWLIDEEVKKDNIAFMVENGEKEYSFEIVGIRDKKADVLWRYTIGGSSDVKNAFAPELIALNLNQ